MLQETNSVPKNRIRVLGTQFVPSQHKSCRSNTSRAVATQFVVQEPATNNDVVTRKTIQWVVGVINSRYGGKWAKSHVTRKTDGFGTTSTNPCYRASRAKSPRDIEFKWIMHSLAQTTGN